jgi:hypothetical protein
MLSRPVHHAPPLCACLLPLRDRVFLKLVECCEEGFVLELNIAVQRPPLRRPH